MYKDSQPNAAVTVDYLRGEIKYEKKTQTVMTAK